MKKTTTIILLLLITTYNTTNLNTCILSKLHTKTQNNSLLTKGNLNQTLLLQKIKTNYDLLPLPLKTLINECKSDITPLIKKCENFYGKNNCEKINKFTVGLKCPENYVRDDITRCVRNCDKKKKIIDHDCEKFKSYYLKEFKKFGSLEECLGNSSYCVKDEDEESFFEDCELNFKRISFLCVPYCFNEIVGGVREKILKDEKFCLKDYVSVGVPFYDF